MLFFISSFKNLLRINQGCLQSNKGSLNPGGALVDKQVSCGVFTKLDVLWMPESLTVIEVYIFCLKAKL